MAKNVFLIMVHIFGNNVAPEVNGATALNFFKNPVQFWNFFQNLSVLGSSPTRVIFIITNYLNLLNFFSFNQFW